jgi:hypothetical protein
MLGRARATVVASTPAECRRAALPPKRSVAAAVRRRLIVERVVGGAARAGCPSNPRNAQGPNLVFSLTFWAGHQHGLRPVVAQ